MIKSHNIITGAVVTAAVVGGGSVSQASAESFPQHQQQQRIEIKHPGLDQQAETGVTSIATGLANLLKSKRADVSYVHNNVGHNQSQYTIDIPSNTAVGKLYGAYNLSFIAPNNKNNTPNPKQVKVLDLTEGASDNLEVVDYPESTVIFAKDSTTGGWMFEGSYSTPETPFIGLVAYTEPSAHETFLNSVRLNAVLNQGKYIVEQAITQQPTEELQAPFSPTPGVSPIPVK
jgi:hypothetical protein